MKAFRIPFGILIAATAGWNCAHYSFSGALPGNIKTVAVPLFDDQTSEFGVREELSDAIIAEITRDNTLKIADRSRADAVVQGTLLRVRDQAGVFSTESKTRQETVQEIRVYVTIRVKLQEARNKKVLWEEELTQWGSYRPAGGDGGSRRDAIREAINKLAIDVLNKTVAGW